MRIVADASFAHLADANTRIRHPAERGAWIWHPGKAAHESAVLRFRLAFALERPTRVSLHVSADQRFQLRANGDSVSYGPDRGDVEHWTVQSLVLDLAAGTHDLEALVWYLGATEEYRPPMAQMSWRGGFLLTAESPEPVNLNTGSAGWTVEDLTPAVTLRRPVLTGYHDIGPEYEFELGKWHSAAAVPAVVVQPGLTENLHGVRRPGWCLSPATLPEQKRSVWRGGRIRAWRETPAAESWDAASLAAPVIPALNRWLHGADPLEIPAHSEIEMIWDLESYVCGYPRPTWSGGAGATIGWGWAESLYEETSAARVNQTTRKGHRTELSGKVFVGIEDRWRSQGPNEGEPAPSLWWRCGRYVRLRIRTGAAALRLDPPAILTTGYPLGPAATWNSSDAAWDALMPFFERSLRAAAHEIWVDTPYYEQLGYVGDNVLMALHNYAWFEDARLSRRAIELFDWSRAGSGLVAERYPSAWRQESSTFALLWPAMVRDYAWWRRDPAFVRARLEGVRAILAAFDALTDRDGLLGHVPGWPFVDWVPDWLEGCGPGVREGDSSIVNLHHVLALQAAAQVESAVGQPALGRLYARRAQAIFAALLARYWDQERGLLRDATGSDVLSEHAQALALRTGLLSRPQAAGCLHALRRPAPGMARASIYASFQVMDALWLHGDEDELHHRLTAWRALPAQGLLCTPEQPEPTRSDAHAWGAHPAWHSLASIAGVRPAGPFFSRVRIAPLLGPMTEVRCEVVHPAGTLRVAHRRAASGRTLHSEIDLPRDVTGVLEWKGARCELRPGTNHYQLAARA